MSLPFDHTNPWKTLTSNVVYDNKWIQVRHEEVLNPSGGPGIYGVVHYKNKAIGVIPIDDEGYTYLVGQYRYPLEEYSWEIPEGGGPMNEDPLEGAKRELLEETGLVAAKWTKIARVHLSNSVGDEEGFLYIAEDLTQAQQQPEDTEQLHVARIPLQEAIEMVMRSEITDSLSVMGLLKVARLRGI
ncbi:NUDIX hydrolase [Runella sp. MFBS21]|uniref:NUDIX domain-containing protein n=1 Tax=Runella sp. MFBS21 TaxID=3034018 RepID=UPI0023F77CF0|nr:NUDIX hydrolase [Runella sp. MFBS21]MDF7820576.1 NUDIX hydrolase [Runella sp. MFBS21]